MLHSLSAGQDVCPVLSGSASADDGAESDGAKVRGEFMGYCLKCWRWQKLVPLYPHLWCAGITQDYAMTVVCQGCMSELNNNRAIEAEASCKAADVTLQEVQAILGNLK